MHARALPSVALRRSSPHDRVSPLWQVGGAGELDLEKGTKIKQRSEAGGTKGAVLNSGVKLDPTSKVPLADQLRETLFKEAVGVRSLFNSWDANGDSVLDPAEFASGMAALGVSGAQASELFAQFDSDSAGTITLPKFNALLRSGNDVQLDAVMQVGGAGELDLEKGTNAYKQG